MIHSIKSTKKAVLLLIIVLSLSGCRDQDEMFRQYVPKGGVVYPTKAENAIAKSGIGRVYISWPNTTPSVTKAGIWWNNYGDSVMVAITTNTDTVTQSIDLPEGIYSFIIKTFDKKGNVSVPVEIIGRSIGEKYMSRFYNRTVFKYTTKGKNSLIIEWDDADISNGALYNEVVYTDSDNIEKTVRISASERITAIENYKQGTAFKYNTIYKPDPKEELEISTSYKEVTDIYLMLDKSIGKVIAYSSQWNADAGQRASNAYDGITNRNRWHSFNGGYPHFVTIDLGGETNISRLTIWPSTYDGKPDNRMPSLIRWEISTDNSTWTKIGEYDYTFDATETNWDPREYYIAPVNARYVRLWGLNDPSGSSIMCLAEIDVYSSIGNPIENLTPPNLWGKNEWKVIALSSEWNAGNAAQLIFDSKKNTYWHSEPFDTSKNGMPQWFIVDMQKERPPFNGFKIWNRQDDHGLEPKNIRFSVSNNQTTWTPILELTEMSKQWQTELDYATASKVGGRYLKVEVLSNWSGGNWTYIAEITPY